MSDLFEFERLYKGNLWKQKHEKPMVWPYKVFSKDTMCKCKVEEENDEKKIFFVVKNFTFWYPNFISIEK